MLLVIPAIDLRGGRCLREDRAAAETAYFGDPVKMAKLWRVQNARVLHLEDRDAAGEGDGRTSNRATIREIAGALDIPVQVGGGVRTMDDVDALLGTGVYRVVLAPEADPAFVEAAVAKHTCSRVVAALDAARGNAPELEPVIDRALELERRGVRRFLYRAAPAGRLDTAALRALGAALGKARLTAAGGVAGYRDLLRLHELEPLGLDSAIVGRALYENRFPCQQFWCWHRKDDLDLDRFSTARLAQPDVDACE